MDAVEIHARLCTSARYVKDQAMGRLIAKPVDTELITRLGQEAPEMRNKRDPPIHALDGQEPLEVPNWEAEERIIIITNTSKSAY